MRSVSNKRVVNRILITIAFWILNVNFKELTKRIKYVYHIFVRCEKVIDFLLDEYKELIDFVISPKFLLIKKVERYVSGAYFLKSHYRFFAAISFAKNKGRMGVIASSPFYLADANWQWKRIGGHWLALPSA